MSETNIEDVFALFSQANDNIKFLTALIELRKLVDGECPSYRDNVRKIRERGPLRRMVSSLQNSKRSIINIDLSILGNCALDAKSATEMISQCSLLSNLNQILKRFPTDDTINGRVFRIVGNLCLHTEQWGNVILEKKPQIVIHVVQYLKKGAEKNEGVSDATLSMGLRALRELINRDNVAKLVETHEVLKCVGALLIKYGDLYEEKKNGDEVIINIIRLLHDYSKYSHYSMITEMQATPKGDSIAYLSKILLISPLVVVKTVMNFLKITKLKSDLPIPEIFDKFIEVLPDEAIQEFNSSCKEYIKCVCYLLDHPGNREVERCGDCIKLLIKVLNKLPLDDNKKLETCHMILTTMNKCRYNSNLISEQLKCNMIAALNEKMKLIVGGVEPLNVYHKSEKKRKTNHTKFKKIKKLRLTDYYNNEDRSDASSSDSEDLDPLYSNRKRYDLSPASSNESDLFSWTSGWSPQWSPSSPNSRFCDFISEMLATDSDDYSPVCSEADPSEYQSDQDDFGGAEQESKENDIPEEVEEIPGVNDDSTVREMKIKIILEIVELLKTYVKITPPVPHLENPEFLLRLIKSSGFFEWPNPSAVNDIITVIANILESHDHLIPLMNSDFIPAVHGLTNMYHGPWCPKCDLYHRVGASIMKKLAKVAESGGGRGDIAHRLLRGDSDTKQQLVLVIPYITKTRSILTKFMMNCGGLEILLKLLQDQSCLLQKKTIKALYVLAGTQLGIPNPKKLSRSCKTNVTEYEPADPPTFVTFKLDDGSTLNADRDLLSKSSDFFARLLNGDFKESSQDVITLPNVTKPALAYLIGFMKDQDRIELVDVDLDLETHLDVIGLCDRFLMEEYRVYLTDCVEKFRLSWDTIPTIYNWALESKTNLLRVECVAFALVVNCGDSQRFKMFEDLFQLGYTEELVDDIRKLLVRYM